MDDEARVADAAEVPEESTYLFTVRERDSGEEKEAILVRDGGGIHAWLNYCQHFTHIKLDKGAGAEMRVGEIVCTNHGAYFEAETGFCTFGPCEGAYLTELEVSVDDDGVHLVDPEYEFVRPGPMETDDLDLESKSNYEF